MCNCCSTAFGRLLCKVLNKIRLLAQESSPKSDSFPLPPVQLLGSLVCLSLAAATPYAQAPLPGQEGYRVQAPARIPSEVFSAPTVPPPPPPTPSQLYATPRQQEQEPAAAQQPTVVEDAPRAAGPPAPPPVSSEQAL